MQERGRLRVVITGASAGIGRAAAIEFARQGAYVALLARGADGLIPGLLDRLLAHKAWKGQVGGEPVDLAQRMDNLHSPVPRDHGAHGRFDAAALRSSLQARLGASPRLLAYLGTAALVLLSVGLYRRR